MPFTTSSLFRIVKLTVSFGVVSRLYAGTTDRSAFLIRTLLTGIQHREQSIRRFLKPYKRYMQVLTGFWMLIGFS